MNMKLREKLLDQIFDHLNESQGKDLYEMLTESRKPEKELEVENPLEKEIPENSLDYESEDKPKGIAIQKVEILKKPKAKADSDIEKILGDEPKEEELSDEDLEDLIREHLK